MSYIIHIVAQSKTSVPYILTSKRPDRPDILDNASFTNENVMEITQK